MKRIISIDHGNRLIKSTHYAFSAAFVDSSHLPSIGGDVLKYNGKAYTVVDQSLPVLTDKTEDERYFVLTLFALGHELDEDMDMMRKLTPHDHVQVELLIGLPLQHFEAYKTKFERYFTDRGGVIRFEFNGKPYSIQLTDAHAFPQAYAAAITVYDRLKGSNIVNVIDIGGYTVDCLQLNRFKPNMTLCTSLYWGANQLFQSINDQVRATGGRDISNSIIEGILSKDPSESRGVQQATHRRYHISRRFPCGAHVS